MAIKTEFNIRPIFDFVDKQGKKYQLTSPSLHRFLYASWVALGGGSDDIDALHRKIAFQLNSLNDDEEERSYTFIEDEVDDTFSPVPVERDWPLETTDNGIVRFDGVDGEIKDSGVTIDDSDNVVIPGDLEVQNRFLGAKGDDVASANDITLGDGNYFDITGTTNINTISATGWTEGSIVTLQFDAILTVNHLTSGTGAQIDLQGAANFTTAAGDHLVLQYASSQWHELTRKT